MSSTIATAFAPAAISNFFAIHDEGSREETDLSKVGATGGGFTLSKGVHSLARVVPGSGPKKLKVNVKGNPRCRATTTLYALDMLLNHYDLRFSSLELDQVVEVPVGYGFGSSAASALSGVLAAARALGVEAKLERVAYFAHAAEILCGTGLGTVSSIYRNAGAGLITRPGGPGVAEVLRIDASRTMRIVTASVAPFRKSKFLSSRDFRLRANRLGGGALRSVLRSPTMESLVAAGTRFASGIGLQTRRTRRLIEVALTNGAIGASQNMIGEAVHAIVEDEMSHPLAKAFASSPLAPHVDIFEIGTRSTSVAGPGLPNYPKTTSSLV